jgi:uncharacterized OB-fold protein
MDNTIATPVVNGETEYYWECAENKQLVLPWCKNCAKYFFYPRSFCPRCWTEEVTWQVSPGRGTVYSYTVVRRMGVEPFANLVPYVLAIIELDEGVRMLSHVRDVAPSEMVVGMAVEVMFEDIGGGRAVPLFRPSQPPRALETERSVVAGGPAS